MKILKEAKKEQLPITVLTDFVSNGWEEVGRLKDLTSAISTSFSGTAKVEKIMQSLIDAYLIALGQMELHMQNKDYIEFPNEVDEVKESLKEEIDSETRDEIAYLIKDEVKAIDGYNAAATKVDKKCVSTINHIRDEEAEHIDELSSLLMDKQLNDAEICLDTFDCDFDEPDNTVERVTDKDLYKD